MPSFHFKIRGEKAMRKRIERIASSSVDRMVTAVRIEAELVMTDSKQNYVPIDLGTLRSSGFVNDVERQGREISATLGFGGAASDYALPVHEHPSKYSPPSWKNVRNSLGQFRKVQFHPEGRGPKYLEKPLMLAIPGMAERIAVRLNIETL